MYLSDLLDEDLEHRSFQRFKAILDQKCDVNLVSKMTEDYIQMIRFGVLGRIRTLTDQIAEPLKINPLNDKFSTLDWMRTPITVYEINCMIDGWDEVCYLTLFKDQDTIRLFLISTQTGNMEEYRFNPLKELTHYAVYHYVYDGTKFRLDTGGHLYDLQENSAYCHKPKYASQFIFDRIISCKELVNYTLQPS